MKVVRSALSQSWVAAEQAHARDPRHESCHVPSWGWRARDARRSAAYSESQR
jgi:hypothetical protein